MMHYWFMAPISVCVAILATGSGFGGGILFFPLFIYILNFSVPEAVGTGMITELCGMTTAMITYACQKQVEFEIALPMVIISFPGVLAGLYIIQIVNPVFPKFFFGVTVIGCALWVLFSIRKPVGSKSANIPVEEIIPYLWIPFIGGISSGISSVGTAETILPALERKLEIEMHRAIATTVVVEGAVAWMASSINIWEGTIRWEVAAFTITGVVIGGRLGPVISKHIDQKFLKCLFASFVIMAGLQIIYNNI